MVVGGASDQRAGCHPNRRPSLGERYSRILPGRVSPLSKGDCFRKVALSFFPLLPKRRRGRGEEAVFHRLPLSPTLSPLVPRGERGKNALRVFHAENKWRLPHWIGFSIKNAEGIFPSLRSEKHTSELQSPYDLVCRLLPEKKKP